MIQSMTGFASTTITLATPTVTIPATLTIKTLNNRFLDVTCKLPYQLAHLEPEFIKQCKKTLHRGSIFCALYITNQQALKNDVFPSVTLAESYLKAINTLQTTLKLPGTITINEFVHLPHLFEATEEADLSNNSSIVLEALQKLLNTLVQTREVEGRALQKDLEQRMEIIRGSMALIEPRAQEVTETKKNKLIDELKNILGHLSPETKDRELQTLYSSIERIDVNEEIVRFKTHLENFLNTLHDVQEQKGKKLDFILQEMFREINTLNAKLPDIISSTPLITIKVELEKAREQVQNIV